MKIYFDMVGCRLNQAEIDLYAMKCLAEGDSLVSKAGDAERIYVNTCCVTKKAAADSRKMVRKYQRETNANVVAMGCWPSAMPEDALSILDAEDIIYNDEKFCLLEYGTIDLSEVKDKPKLGQRQRTRAFVKVQDGCLNQCAFCLTTIARGRARSARQEDIVRYINKLEKLGNKEIVLTGVQLGSWGVDLGESLRIADLIKTILSETGIPRIRLSSIEPWDISKELINLFQNERLCNHLHIPVQSASDKILKSMRRPLTREKLEDLFSMINKFAPNVAITSDILLGFPGEDENDFNETLSFIRNSGMSGGHVFSFSSMPGTVAERMEGQVQASITKERNKIARDLLDQLSYKYKRKRLNTEDKVLFESKLRIGEQFFWSGLTMDMLRVLVPSELNLKNCIYRVELGKMNENGRLFGKVISD